jgi:peptidoglycan hydrolase-like protein with peptidoglycan-binding domain
MANVRETRLRDVSASSASASGARPREEPLDDWLGEVSDEDWSEDAAERAERRRATPAYEGVPAPEEAVGRERAADRPTADRPVDAAESHRAVIERRRIVAGLLLAVVLGLGVVIPVVLLRGGGEEPTSTVVEPSTTTPPPTESGPSAPTTTTPTTPSTTTPSTPSTPDATGFTLPEGTKLGIDEEGDPALVRELQQALSAAGYDPGPVDGTFGPRTEAAVVAFQQDNGLSADGVVGPETAAALSNAETTDTAPEVTPSTPTTPSTPGVSGFTLPEGTKLGVEEEGDPALVRELQQALSSAGYDPGTVDGTFGEETEAAVVAFQEANGLSADGVVGPETAAALNSALASG